MENGSNSSYNCTPFLLSLLAKGKKMSKKCRDVLFWAGCEGVLAWVAFAEENRTALERHPTDVLFFTLEGSASERMVARAFS